MPLLDFKKAAENDVCFKSHYPFTCPHCGHEQNSRPSIAITKWGCNTGGGNCSECKGYVFLSITADNEHMAAFKTHLEREEVLSRG